MLFIHTSTCILASCSYTCKCCCILFAATISCQGWSTAGRQGIVPHVPQKLLAMVARAFSAVIPLLVYLGNLLHTCSLPASSDATPRLPPPGVTPLADDPAELGISREPTLSTQFEPLASWFHAVWADTYLFTLTDLGNTSTLTQPLHWWVRSASSDTFSTWRNSTSTQPILTTTDAGTPESSFQWAASASKGSPNATAMGTSSGFFYPQDIETLWTDLGNLLGVPQLRHPTPGDWRKATQPTPEDTSPPSRQYPLETNSQDLRKTAFLAPRSKTSQSLRETPGSPKDFGASAAFTQNHQFRTRRLASLAPNRTKPTLWQQWFGSPSLEHTYFEPFATGAL